MSSQAIAPISPGQYLEIERAAETSEYRDGRMFERPGCSLAHSLVSVSLIAVLSIDLDGKGCEIAGSDLRIRISPEGPYVYPDVSVYFGEPELAADYKDTLLNPVLVIEVLSKSSEAYDRGHKFAAYRRSASLREYVLVSQTEPRIEVFSKDDQGRWIYTESVGMNSVCLLPGMGCEIPLTNIYKRIKFDEASR